jgi:hypothetical protein
VIRTCYDGTDNMKAYGGTDHMKAQEAHEGISA